MLSKTLRSGIFLGMNHCRHLACRFLDLQPKQERRIIWQPWCNAKQVEVHLGQNCVLVTKRFELRAMPKRPLDARFRKRLIGLGVLVRHPQPSRVSQVIDELHK